MNVITSINICTIIPDFPLYQLLTNEKFDIAQFFHGSKNNTGTIEIIDKLLNT